MRLSAPKKATFWVAVVLFVLSVLGFWVAFLGDYQLWLAYAAFLILAAGNYLKGF
ncbi:MAG: hypothetical protein HON98_11540 [Chloroflexi bacterium]|jgi:hypothetical protein|nr:hypothetical protein [Chloroflexota bacterium]MBT3670771.1 hypothetical protein [Chloroflexota bacterium]MBT4004144.1 hypothetical protein [Chloroflexota bacterium]MBT4305139.1 hypothetical protein [Chloroflexota bacterium]MBT4533339.1 hypothetical protein [Chloroflexota bacterium]